MPIAILWWNGYKVKGYIEYLNTITVDASSLGMFEDERRRRMLSVNPVYVPRNWLIHEAILDAEMDNFDKVSARNWRIYIA